MNVLLAAAFCFLAAVSAAGQRTADLLLINGKVRTLDKKRSQAEAIAVADGRIVAVGTNVQVKALARPDARVIDAQGKLVIPGFNDAHVHFTGIGNQFSHLPLKGQNSSSAVVARVTEFTRLLPKGRWLLGAGLDPEHLPTLKQLDAASPENPVLLYFADPKSVLVNSAALRIGRVPFTADGPSDSEVVRNNEGRPTGVLTGATLRAIRSTVPNNYATNWAEIAETASNYAASLGITSVQDVHSDDLLETLNAMAKAGRLKTRIYECIGIREWRRLSQSDIKAASGDAMVRGGCVKGTASGGDGEVGDLRRAISDADKAGLQVMIHAIGARANANTLEAFEFVAGQNGRRDRRFRIEHAHNMRAEDLSRLARTSIIPSMQPYLFFYGHNTGGDNFRELFRLGVTVAFGSDASITDFNPLLGIHVAVNAGGDRSLSVGDALAAYTVGSAYAEFQENEKGTLGPGKLADFVILSEDIFTIDPMKIDRAHVLTTVVDGKVVYDAG